MAAAEAVDIGAVDVTDVELPEQVLGIVLKAAVEDVAASTELTMGSVPDIA